MYVEDEVGQQPALAEQAGFTYGAPVHGIRHCIAVFTGSPDVRSCYVDADIRQEQTFRMHCRRAAEGAAESTWMHDYTEWIEKYMGRG